MDMATLLLLGAGAYLLWQSQSAGSGAVVTHPGDLVQRTTHPGAAPAPSPGANISPGVLIGPGVQQAKNILTKATDQIPPNSVTPPANIPVVDPATMQAVIASSGLSQAEFDALAAQFNMAPEQFASVVGAVPGTEMAQLVEMAGAGQLTTETLATTGANAMGTFGAWAGPAAAALAIGAAVLMTAMQGEHWNAAKDNQRAKLNRTGKTRTYELINAWFDALLTTGQRPPWMTEQWMYANGFELDALDSAKDLWGPDATYQAALAKQNAYLARHNSYLNWFNQAAAYIWQTVGLGVPSDPERILRNMLAAQPPPDWLPGWVVPQSLMRLSAGTIAAMLVQMYRQGMNIDTVMAFGPEYIAAGGYSIDQPSAA